MIIRKTDVNFQSRQKVLAEQDRWLKTKKRLENDINHSGSGLYARWFDQDCYFMDKYFDEKLEKLKSKKKQEDLIKK